MLSLSPRLLFVFSFFLSLNALSQVTIYQENFNAGIGTFSMVDVIDATDQWTPTGGYVEINGFGGANDEDWLISPAINMDVQGNEYFMFDYNDLNAGALIELYYSVDYNNGGAALDVASATWTNIPLKLIDINSVSCFTTLFQRHPAIDVSAIAGTSVYFGFKYVGLSSTAKRYQIDNVHIDADYYAAIPNGINCAVLKTTLHNLIVNQPDRIRYSSSQYDVWDALLHTDTRMNDANTAVIVWDMFTDFPTTTGEFEFDHCTNRDQGSCPGGEGNCYNREHTFPKSWWGGGTTLSDSIYTDMHHIYASDRSLNTSKSNYPPGNVTAPVTTGTNGVAIGGNSSYPCTSTNYFEPIDEFKGDYARTYFYVVTRYEHNMGAWQTINARGDCFMDGLSYPSIEPWALTVLLQWNAADPVSQKEIDHNNAVYAIQGNRNPFIDNPGFVSLIWGDEFGTPCSITVLPVELVHFEVKKESRSAMISWTTETEINNDYFEVERSMDMIHWETIATVLGAGNSSQSIDYSTKDFNPSYGTDYYRLKQIDFDGNYSYSMIKCANFIASLSYYPNPVENRLTLKGENINETHFEVYDMLGRNVTPFIEVTTVNENELVLNMSPLNPSVYVLKTDTEQITIVKK